MTNNEGELKDGMDDSSVMPEDPATLLRMDIENLKKQNEELLKRLGKTEFLAKSQKKEIEWNRLNEDKNIKFGSLPSLDGTDPIIDWRNMEGGSSYVTADGVMVDTQCWIIKTKSGKEEKIAMSELSARLAGKGVSVRCNNWKSYVENIKDLYDRKNRVQQIIVNKFADKKSIYEELQSIQKEEKELTMNVTVSLDHGVSYQGETFDVLAKMFNGMQ